VNAVNNTRTGKKIRLSQVSLNPKINIRIINGIIERNKLIKAASCADNGKAIVGILIDFSTPELLIIDSITCIVDVEKKIQKTNPVRAYKGYLSISENTFPNTKVNITR